MSENIKVSKYIMKYRNLQLLLMILLFLLLLPFLDKIRFGELISSICLTFILLLSVIATGSNSNKLSKRAIIIGSATLLATWGTFGYDRHWVIILKHIIYFTFFLYIAEVILVRILKEKVVSLNTIYGAACIYVLIGLSWAFLYSLVYYIDPRSFSLKDMSVANMGYMYEHLFDSIYFSFVTLTTLGYGDISPLTRFPKILTVFEAILGQLFMAIFVARFVGMYIAQLTSDDEE